MKSPLCSVLIFKGKHLPLVNRVPGVCGMTDPQRAGAVDIRGGRRCSETHMPGIHKPFLSEAVGTLDGFKLDDKALFLLAHFLSNYNLFILPKDLLIYTSQPGSILLCMQRSLSLQNTFSSSPPCPPSMALLSLQLLLYPRMLSFPASTLSCSMHLHVILSAHVTPSDLLWAKSRIEGHQ